MFFFMQQIQSNDVTDLDDDTSRRDGFAVAVTLMPCHIHFTTTGGVISGLLYLGFKMMVHAESSLWLLKVEHL